MRRIRARAHAEHDAARAPEKRVDGATATHEPLPAPDSETMASSILPSRALLGARGATPAQIATLQSWQRAYGNHAVQRHLRKMKDAASSPFVESGGDAKAGDGESRATAMRPEGSSRAGEPRDRTTAAGASMLQRAPTTTAPPSIDARVKRLENRTKATGHLDEFRESVLARAEDWEMAALNVGTAYATAADRHSKAAADAQRVAALEAQVMGSVAVLLFVGPMGWLSEGIPLVLSQGFEDFAQAGMGEALSAVGPAVVASKDSKPTNLNPQVFQNEAVGKVKAARKSLHEYFAKIVTEMGKAPPESWDKYDETAQKAKHQAWLKQAGLFAGAPQLPAVDAMADEFERGFWAKWAPGLYQGRTYAIFPQDNYAKMREPIQQRLNALGITSAAGLKFGWFSGDDDSRKMIKWGDSYKVKPFM